MSHISYQVVVDLSDFYVPDCTAAKSKLSPQEAFEDAYLSPNAASRLILS